MNIQSVTYPSKVPVNYAAWRALHFHGCKVIRRVSFTQRKAAPNLHRNEIDQIAKGASFANLQNRIFSQDKNPIVVMPVETQAYNLPIAK